MSRQYFSTRQDCFYVVRLLESGSFPHCHRGSACDSLAGLQPAAKHAVYFGSCRVYTCAKDRLLAGFLGKCGMPAARHSSHALLYLCSPEWSVQSFCSSAMDAIQLEGSWADACCFGAQDAARQPCPVRRHAHQCLGLSSRAPDLQSEASLQSTVYDMTSVPKKSASRSDE